MKFSFLFLILSFFTINLDAQVRKILHQSFEIESSNTVSFDLAGEYEFVKWAGNAILVESSIELYSASRAIFNAFKEEGRYDVQSEVTGDVITLRSTDKERLPIRNKDKEECFEIVKVRVLIPEDFEIQDQNTIIRKTPIEVDSGQ
jgi:hypothetical protein